MILLVLKEGTKERFLEQHHVLRDYPALSRVVAVSGTIQDWFEHPDVETAEEDTIVTSAQDITLTRNFNTANWGLVRLIRRNTPWDNLLRFRFTFPYSPVLTGSGVDIYIVDSGIKTTHDEFVSGRATNQTEIVSSAGAGDDFGHGTFCASLAAGNSVGVARAAHLYSFKVLSSDGTGTNGDLTSGLSSVLSFYNGRNNPAVVNLSLQNFGSAVNSAVSDLINAGLVVCVCAGNSREDLASTDQYPAESDADTIRVAGSNVFDNPYYATNFGTGISIVAPSTAIYAADFTGSSLYTVSQGTSFGNALTSGVVACMLQGNSKLTTRTQVQNVKTALLNEATTGKVTVPTGFPTGTLPDKLLYLNPAVTGFSF